MGSGDNRRLPNHLTYKHKVTREALWVDGWSTLPWVKDVLKSVTQGSLQSHVGYDTSASADSGHRNRYWHEDVTSGIFFIDDKK